VDASVEESETISRTLLLAQRTADNAVAEARAEAARIVGRANDEAATTLDSTREMSAQLIAEARIEARRAGEAERQSITSEVEALKARRDFLESDVHHLETFLVDQRSRVREAATSLMELTERVPGGLGDARAPLLSASDDDTGEIAMEDDPADLLIVTDISTDDDIADPGPDPIEPADEERDGRAVDLESDPGVTGDQTEAIPVFSADPEDGPTDPNDDFKFSFDDERR
jgi:vacuolar-type H+-ATPase subunit H